MTNLDTAFLFFSILSWQKCYTIYVHQRLKTDDAGLVLNQYYPRGTTVEAKRAHTGNTTYFISRILAYKKRLKTMLRRDRIFISNSWCCKFKLQLESAVFSKIVSTVYGFIDRNHIGPRVKLILIQYLSRHNYFYLGNNGLV